MFYHLPHLNDVDSIDSLTSVVTWQLQLAGVTISLALILFSIWSLVDLGDVEVTPFRHFCAIVARLEYAFFLVHPVLMMIIVAWMGVTFTSFSMVLLAVLPSLLIASVIVSTVLRLTVEMPFARLLNLSLKKIIPAGKKN